MAQVDAKLPVTVIDCGRRSRRPESRRTTAQPAGWPGEPSLDAYKKLGQSFVGLNGGAMYALSPNGGSS